MAGPVPAYAASGCGGEGPCVVVEVAETGSTTTFDLDELLALEDVFDQSFVLRESSGASQSLSVAAATSLRAVVAAVPVDPDSVTYTEVLDTSGVAHRLAAGELGAAGSNGFAGGLEPVVYPSGGDGEVLTYIRPLRSSEDVNVSSDPNYGGYFATADGGALHVMVHTTGELLNPVIDADDLTPSLGDAVALSVSFDEEPGTSLTYAWDFGDGTGSTDPAPTHAWTDAGSYWVNLTVTGSNAVGRADAVKVTVGEAASATATATAGDGVATSAAPSVGPTKSGGRHQGGKASTATGPTAGATASATTGASSGATASAATATATATASASSSAEPTATAAGDRIEGVVLVAAGQAPAAGGEQIAAAARGGQVPGSWGLPGWSGGVGAGVLLLGLGALAEARPRWWRRRGRMWP
ncbi:PKD domain-containing protein [Nocardioides sp.]|uniref:PKD domain-containing protein n=1 Tax=Nocardioides sp. TaxID=35761 RepID=UPI0039E4E70E